MTKKLTATLTIAACAALWGAVCPQNTSGGKVPASEQTTNIAAVAQAEHTRVDSRSAAENEQTQDKEISPLHPTEESVSESVPTNSQLPATPQKESAAPEAKPAQAPGPTTAALQPAQTLQPQSAVTPAPGERSVADDKAQVWVPGFGWVEDGGGNVYTYAADMYENGNKIGSMG